MHAMRTGALPALALAALLVPAATGSSQTGTAEPPSVAPADKLPPVPGITVDPPLDRPAGPDRRSGGPEAGADMPLDSPGCPYRDNKLDLIV